MDKQEKIALPANAPAPLILQKIEVRPWNRTQQDIPNWRRAIVSAESQIPRRVLLYNLYADVDLDGHVEAVTGKRRDHVKSANWQFVDKEGKPVDEINDLIDSIGFDDLLEEIINARFWGYSILEPTFWIGEDGKWQMDAGLLPRLNYRPEKGIVAKQIYGEEGVNIREGIYAKTVMEVGKINDLGLYMKAAPYQILKRGGLGDYAAFIQTYGNPIIDATWDGVDEAQRLALGKALEELGAGGALVRPAGTTVEIKENNVNSTGDAHGSFFRLLNNEISKALLGTTETTESSSSSGYAQSETHQEQDDVKHENDLAYCRKYLNSRFIRLMQTAGLDSKGGWFIIEGESTQLSKSESFDIHRSLATEIGLPIEDDFWYDNYDVSKPENYDQLKAEKEQAKAVVKEKPGTQQPPDGEDPKEDKKEEVKLADNFIKRIASFFVKAPAETTGAMTEPCGHHHIIELAESDRIDSDALINRIYKAGGKANFDADLFWQTSNVLIKGFKEGWDTSKMVKLTEAPGFTYGVDDPAMLTAFEQNLFRFSGAKTLAEVQELNQLFRQSSSFSEFYRLARERVEVFNKDWLETEYNSAYHTGAAASTYHRLMSQTDTFPYWEYKTVGDNRVRPEHALLDGLILPYDDPRWAKIFPPNGWNCRCRVIPKLPHEVDRSKLKQMQARADHYINSPQFAKEKAMGWGVNRAASGEVFSANQQYARKFPDKASKDLNDLMAQDWELKSYSNAKKTATGDVPLYDGKAKAFYDALKEAQGVKVVQDYHSRPLRAVKSHFNADKDNTVLLSAMQEALKKPDEVWMNGENLENLIYLKYFNGQTIVAQGSISGNGIKLADWFALVEDKENIARIRKGLLIFKK